VVLRIRGRVRALTVGILGRQQSGVLGVGYAPVGVPQVVARSVDGPVLVVGTRADRRLAPGALRSRRDLAETENARDTVQNTFVVTASSLTFGVPAAVPSRTTKARTRNRTAARGTRRADVRRIPEAGTTVRGIWP